MKRLSVNNESNTFQVFIRVRPLNEYQINHQNGSDYIQYDQKQISVKTRNESHQFTFDKIYDQKSTQQQVFQGVADDIIDNAFMGINGTIFCYGQTSSGKTHTIVGDYNNKQEIDGQGLLPRVLRDVIGRKNTKIYNIKESNVDIRIKISMVEIYNQKVKDLLDLNKPDLKLRENKKQGVFIQNVTEKYIVGIQEAMSFVKQGLENRTVGRTNLNAYSSRSHMVFIITINETNFQTREAKSAKITLTDLAGSEKISKTGVQGKMLIQAKKINTSLSTLGKVIQALSQSKSAHIPYRDSKLTRLLQQSIGGNSLTRLIINVSPSYINQYETLTSLRFGSRAKLIQNQPKVNKEYTVQELLGLLEKAEIKIKKQMKIIEELQKGFNTTGNTFRRHERYGMMSQAITLHLIGDDDQYEEEDFDDTSSIGSHCLSKSVMEFKDLMIGQSLNQFNQSDFDYTSTTLKKKCRKPNLNTSKSMKSIFNQDNQIYQQEPNIPIQNLGNRSKIKRKVTISGIIENSQQSQQKLQKINTIHQQQQSAGQQSLKQPQKKKNLQNRQQNKQQKQVQVKTLKEIQVIGAQVNQLIMEQLKSNLSQQIKDKVREQLCKQLREQLREQLLKQLREQVHKQVRKQVQQQVGKQVESQLQEQLKQSVEESIITSHKTQLNILQSTVIQLQQQLKKKQQKLNDISIKYQQTIGIVEQQKQTIKDKDNHIMELKDKYKHKKNQINKEINKLKMVWQVAH